MFDVSKPSTNAKKVSLKQKVSEISNALAKIQIGKAQKSDYDIVKKAFDSRTLRATVVQNALAIKNPASSKGGLAGAASALAGAAASALSSAAGIGGDAGKKDNPIAPLSTNFEVDSIVEINDKMFVVTLGFPMDGDTKYGIPIGSSIVFRWASENWGGLVNGLDANVSPILTGAKSFLDAKENPIVKYFEDNTFRGLACTIDSMNFSWLDENLWEVAEPGSRAPKSCIVTLSLTPIHDIAPGLDSDGFNRAPVYRVGKQIAAITNPTETDNIKRVDLKPGSANKSSDSASVLSIGPIKIP
jgi:hypothetical protein